MKKLFVDLDLCIGCQAHSVACNRVNHDILTMQSSEIADEATLPVVCRHCESAACVAACPNESMKRHEDGIVRRSMAMCTGCMSCTLACPFGVLTRGMRLARHSSSKCDLCASRVERRLEPACVATCPTGALQFREVEEVYEAKEVLVVGAHTIGHSPYIRRA
ncbi:MAG: 4Fe-4S binding protein [Candidatus Hydrogenedentes bacterium]|nr:4Fe-4S binding protein [Candidatus Hydrogenedentota bacterium]